MNSPAFPARPQGIFHEYPHPCSGRLGGDRIARGSGSGAILSAAAGLSAVPAAVSAEPAALPGQPGYGDAQQGYSGTNQASGTQNSISQIINSLFGNRYNVGDREAVSSCASAAMTQATAQYGVNGYAGSDGYAGYAGAYRPGATGVPGYPGVATSMRVSAITDVQRRSDGMRVKGLIDSGVDYRGGYGGEAYQGPGTGGQAYANRYPSHNDVSFRCNLDNRGIVTRCASTATPRPTAVSKAAARREDPAGHRRLAAAPPSARSLPRLTVTSAIITVVVALFAMAAQRFV